MDKIRAFLSLNLNNEVKLALASVQSDVKALLCDYKIKWEKPDKFHLTVRFLGDVSADNINLLTTELAKVKFGFSSLEFETNSIGFFPNAKRPNVIYLGLDEKTTNAETFVNELDTVLKKFDMIPDKKFVPHITLGRFSRDNRQRIDDITFPDYEKMKIVFDKFYLMQSQLTQSGSIYEVIQSFRFNNS